MEIARDMARRYLPDAVHFLAGLALAPDSEAPLHTRMMAAKEIISVAGVIPQAAPEPPAPAPAPPRREDGREPDA
jgi:hypothetical protein